MSDLQSTPGWLSHLYPFVGRDIQTAAGARMNYLDEGPRHDEAVLMLHGNPTWSFYYRNLVSALSPATRCIVPDHVGMGRSEKPSNHEYRLATRIADVETLVAALRVKRVHLVVHDWGGAIGFGFAARHPEMIGRIVILNTAAFTSDRIPTRIAICKAPVVGPLIVRGCNGFAGPATWMAMHRRRLTPDEKRGYLWPYDSWANRVAVCAFVRDIPLKPSHPSWSTLRAVEDGLAQFQNRQVLMIWGGRDFCFNDSFLGRWREIYPQAQVRRLPDAGHYVLEDASDEVVPEITRFLQNS